MKIGIIGGGAAGLIAAIKTEQLGMHVTLYDANTNLGRKLSATGSGRCNISNLHAAANTYYSDSPESLQKCFQNLPMSSIRDFLLEIGIPTTSTPDGWVYPCSFSGSNVVDILSNNLQNTKIHLNSLITSIEKKGNVYLLQTQDGSVSHAFERVIIACGSPANPQLGARSVLQKELTRLGHHLLPIKPALAPIETDTTHFHKLQGVRLDAGITLMRNDEKVVETFGNIIFTKWGLNGPGVMNISHLIEAKHTQQYHLKINFIAGFEEDIMRAFEDNKKAHLSPSSLLMAYLPQKVCALILKQNKLENVKRSSQMSKQQKEALINTLKNQIVQVRAVRGFKYAQASVGGIPLSEIDPQSMRSRFNEGLYIVGEMINVLGPCGGYNLHWAILSALIAAQAASMA